MNRNSKPAIKKRIADCKKELSIYEGMTDYPLKDQAIASLKSTIEFLENKLK